MKKIVKLFVSVWHLGARGTTHALRRQIELTNLVALATVGAIPFYVVMYVSLGRAFWPVAWFLAACCVNGGLVLLLNWRRRHIWARNQLIYSAWAMFIVVSALVGSDAGVHLYLFPLLSTIAFLFERLRIGWYVFQCVAITVLFVLCQLMFLPSAVPMPLPASLSHVLFVVCASSAMLFMGLFLFLFRVSLDRSERELITHNAHLQDLSNIDPLTDLPNRRALDVALHREWGRLSRREWVLTVMMCDIDFFKKYNDRYGHDAGDQCLKRVAATLRQSLLRPADMVARYGGEEFMMVLPDTGPAAAGALAEKMREAIVRMAIPHEGSPDKGIVTVSIGYTSVGPGQKGSLEALMKRADEALYAAKKKGRNRAEHLLYDGQEEMASA